MHAAVPPPEDEESLGPAGDPEATARIICLRLLDSRARSRAELAAALRKRGIPDAAAAAVLDRYQEVGLIDDAALATAMAGAVHRERGLARRAVATKLRRRGIDEETVRAAIGQISGDDERSAAERLVAKKQRSLQALPPEVQARRLVGMLARRGYAAELAHQVVRAAVSGVDGASN
jgi:regulatory protein